MPSTPLQRQLDEHLSLAACELMEGEAQASSLLGAPMGLALLGSEQG